MVEQGTGCMADHLTTDSIKLGVVGVSGRMGQMLVETISDTCSVCLAGATEQSGHPWVNSTIAKKIPHINSDILIRDKPSVAFAEVAAIIDFSSPAATVENAKFAASSGIVHVVGTTGMSTAELTEISRFAESAVIIRAGNMSLGVNLLVGLTASVARVLGPEFDIEILEHHHRHKVDAPSGTALMLGEAAARGRNISLETASDRGRDGITGSRKSGNIGFSAVRGGDVVGEHDVIFAGQGERLILRHIATDRTIYARGAVNAAIWGLKQDFGEYDMNDVLGIGK